MNCYCLALIHNNNNSEITIIQKRKSRYNQVADFLYPIIAGISG